MPAPPSVAHVPPPQEALSAMLAPSSQVLRYVTINNADGTEYASVETSGVISGSVSVDQTRTERRAFELELDNSDGRFRHQKGYLWYDKIIRIWRGVQYVNSSGVMVEWTTQVGEYMIDSITSQDFPHTVHIQGRDFTKKLMNSKFKIPTAFAKGQPIETVINTIATAGGITKKSLPTTGVITGKDWYFDAGITRWEAITQIATNYGYEIYMDGTGYLVMRLFQDPVSSPIQAIFNTGLGGVQINVGGFLVTTNPGNLVSYQKSSKDARLYNSIVVTGESTGIVPVTAFAANTTPGSPTSIAAIGERVYRYSSAFIATLTQAQTVANNFLKIHSLEEYDLTLGSIVLPWLEAGDIVFFADPDPVAGEPARFLLSNFTIPLTLGGMDSTCKRVVIV